MSSFITELETRITPRADLLEEIHLCAAIDAQLTNVPTVAASSKSQISASSRIDAMTMQPKSTEEVIFDDYINPNSVRNCFSPFVPSSSDRIKSFINDTQLKPNDVVLDIGCGDGRVCIAVTKSAGEIITIWIHRCWVHLFSSSSCMDTFEFESNILFASIVFIARRWLFCIRLQINWTGRLSSLHSVGKNYCGRRKSRWWSVPLFSNRCNSGSWCIAGRWVITLPNMYSVPSSRIGLKFLISHHFILFLV